MKKKRKYSSSIRNAEWKRRYFTLVLNSALVWQPTIKFSLSLKFILIFLFFFPEALVEVGASTMFLLPTVPKVLDFISPLPDSRPNIHILEVELLVDRESYYWLYFFWDVTSVIALGTVSVSVDTMFIICIEHCCALHAIIRWSFSFRLLLVLALLVSMCDVEVYTCSLYTRKGKSSECAPRTGQSPLPVG